MNLQLTMKTLLTSGYKWEASLTSEFMKFIKKRRCRTFSDIIRVHTHSFFFFLFCFYLKRRLCKTNDYIGFHSGWSRPVFFEKHFFILFFLLQVLCVFSVQSLRRDKLLSIDGKNEKKYRHYLFLRQINEWTRDAVEEHKRKNEKMILRGRKPCRQKLL